MNEGGAKRLNLSVPRAADGSSSAGSRNDTPRTDLRSASVGRRPLEPPDPAPAQAVRRVLAWDRRINVPFADAWSDALDCLGHLEPRERNGWALALAETRSAWQSAYDGSGEPAPIDLTALL